MKTYSTALAVLLVGCATGTFAPRAADVRLPVYARRATPDAPRVLLDETTRWRHFEYERCQARLYFLRDSETRIRSWNTFLEISAGLLGILSGATGIGTTATTDGTTEDWALAVTSLASGALGVITIAIRAFATTDDDEYIRASALDLSRGLNSRLPDRSLDFATAAERCDEAEGDLGLPNPHLPQLTGTELELVRYYQLGDSVADIQLRSVAPSEATPTPEPVTAPEPAIPPEGP